MWISKSEIRTARCSESVQFSRINNIKIALDDATDNKMQPVRSVDKAWTGWAPGEGDIWEECSPTKFVQNIVEFR